MMSACYSSLVVGLNDADDWLPTTLRAFNHRVASSPRFQMMILSVYIWPLTIWREWINSAIAFSFLRLVFHMAIKVCAKLLSTIAGMLRRLIARIRESFPAISHSIRTSTPRRSETANWQRTDHLSRSLLRRCDAFVPTGSQLALASRLEQLRSAYHPDFQH